MGIGTFRSLRDIGFPIGVPGTELVFKPDAAMPDEAFKRLEAPKLARVGAIVAVVRQRARQLQHDPRAEPGVRERPRRHAAPARGAAARSGRARDRRFPSRVRRACGSALRDGPPPVVRSWRVARLLGSPPAAARRARTTCPDAGVSPQAKAEPAQLENVAVSVERAPLTPDAGPSAVPLRADEEVAAGRAGARRRAAGRSQPTLRTADDPARVPRPRDRDQRRSTPRRRRPSCASRSTCRRRALGSRCEAAASSSRRGPSFARGAIATGTFCSCPTRGEYRIARARARCARSSASAGSTSSR